MPAIANLVARASSVSGNMDDETRKLIEELQRKVEELDGKKGFPVALSPFPWIAAIVATVLVFVLIKTAMDRDWAGSPCNRNCQCGGEPVDKNSHSLSSVNNVEAAASPPLPPSSPPPRSVASSAGPPPYATSSRRIEEERLLDDDPLSKY